MWIVFNMKKQISIIVMMFFSLMGITHAASYGANPFPPFKSYNTESEFKSQYYKPHACKGLGPYACSIALYTGAQHMRYSMESYIRTNAVKLVNSHDGKRFVSDWEKIERNIIKNFEIHLKNIDKSDLNESDKNQLKLGITTAINRAAQRASAFKEEFDHYVLAENVSQYDTNNPHGFNGEFYKSGSKIFDSKHRELHETYGDTLVRFLAAHTPNLNTNDAILKITSDEKRKILAYAQSLFGSVLSNKGTEKYDILVEAQALGAYLKTARTIEK